MTTNKAGGSGGEASVQAMLTDGLSVERAPHSSSFTALATLAVASFFVDLGRAKDVIDASSMRTQSLWIDEHEATEAFVECRRRRSSVLSICRRFFCAFVPAGGMTSPNSVPISEEKMAPVLHGLGSKRAMVDHSMQRIADAAANRQVLEACKANRLGRGEASVAHGGKPLLSPKGSCREATIEEHGAFMGKRNDPHRTTVFGRC